jgi:hypothetical protein
VAKILRGLQSGYLVWLFINKTTPAELIAFPEKNYGSTILVSIIFFEQGKWELLIKYNEESSILIG